MFTDDLQNDINKAWSRQKSDFKFPTNPDIPILPSNLEYVCFANLSNGLRGGNVESKVYSDISIYESANANLFFYPREKACDMPYQNIKHIDIETFKSKLRGQLMFGPNILKEIIDHVFKEGQDEQT